MFLDQNPLWSVNHRYYKHSILLLFGHACSSQSSITNKNQIYISSISYGCILDSFLSKLYIEDIALCLLESIKHSLNHSFPFITIPLLSCMVREYDLHCNIIYKMYYHTHTSDFKECMHQKFLQNNHTLFLDTIWCSYFDL